KPGASAASSYVPGDNSGKANVPSVRVTALARNCVAGSRTVMLARAIAAPLESMTLPDTSARKSCAEALKTIPRTARPVVIQAEARIIQAALQCVTGSIWSAFLRVNKDCGDVMKMLRNPGEGVRSNHVSYAAAFGELFRIVGAALPHPGGLRGP